MSPMMLHKVSLIARLIDPIDSFVFPILGEDHTPFRQSLVGLHRLDIPLRDMNHAGPTGIDE